MFFDITNRKSFDSISRYWIGQIEKNCSDNTPRLLIGNKYDLESLRSVSEEEACNLAYKNNMNYIEVSNKTGTNVETALLLLISKIKGHIESQKLLNDSRICIKDGFVIANDRKQSSRSRQRKPKSYCLV